MKLKRFFGVALTLCTDWLERSSKTFLPGMRVSAAGRR